MDLGTFLGVAGVVLGIIGLIAGYIFYRRGLRTKEPRWTIQTTNLITNHQAQLEKLTILYDSQTIPNLSSSKLAFWNQGKETIDGKDIAQAEPLKIRVAKGVRLLDFEVVKLTNPANQIGLRLTEDHEFLLIFDYLDCGDGVVLQLLHTGTSRDDVTLTGKIKGATLTHIKLVHTADFFDNAIWQRIPAYYRQILVALIAMGAALFFGLWVGVALIALSLTGEISFIVGMLGALAFIIGGITLGWMSIAIWRRAVPRNIHSLIEE